MPFEVLTRPAVQVPAGVNEIIDQLAHFDCYLELDGARHVRIGHDWRANPILPPSIGAAVEHHNDALATYIQQMMVVGAEPRGRC